MTEFEGLPEDMTTHMRGMVEILAAATGVVMVQVPKNVAEDWESLGLLEKNEIGIYVYTPPEE